MIAHVIKDGVVINTINIKSLDHIPELTPFLIDASAGGHIGDLWDGSVFTTPEPTAEEVAEEAAAQADIADTESISNNDVLNLLKNNTSAEIDDMVADMFSALAGMDQTAIDSYLNANISHNVTNIAEANASFLQTKIALSVIANDVSATMKILKFVTKIAVYLAKKFIRLT